MATKAPRHRIRCEAAASARRPICILRRPPPGGRARCGPRFLDAAFDAS
jgi:hypothetical protein